jgi:hypothetical protein
MMIDRLARRRNVGRIELERLRPRDQRGARLLGGLRGTGHGDPAEDRGGGKEPETRSFHSFCVSELNLG